MRSGKMRCVDLNRLIKMHPLTLGGFLAQGVAYQLIEHKIYNVFSSKNSNVATVKETLTDGNYFKKTVTFNAAPFFNVTYTNSPGFFQRRFHLGT